VLIINNLKVGIISDGKYGERAFENISKKFSTTWITVPEIEPTLMLDDDISLDIPDCNLYISYVRHPDIILEIAALNKPLVLGVLPGYGLFQQASEINQRTIHAPTMCSLHNNTGIEEVDCFTKYFGQPIFSISINKEGFINNVEIKRSSLCGSSEAGVKFLKGKYFNVKNLQEFALSICHECRAPRFGRTCDKEVAGIIHLFSVIESIPTENFNYFDKKTKDYIENIKKEYTIRKEKSKLD
jgi:hypothetical protein